MRTLVLWMLVSLAAPGAALAADKFEAIFDGKTLTGWNVIPKEKRGHWSVRDGLLVGKTDGKGSDLILIDEALTPDSSRFWPADQYQPGQAQPSFDKQFVRDYLERLDWDKKPPGPVLPDDVVEATSRRYLEAYALLTGEQLEGS